MKLSDLVKSGAPINIDNINVINVDQDDEEESKKSDKDEINPGIEYDENDQAKWSPPLQQEISIQKSEAGETPDPDTTTPDPEVDVEDLEADSDQEQDQVEFIKKLVSIFDKKEE